jgi:PAS domain S-box-containing protein
MTICPQPAGELSRVDAVDPAQLLSALLDTLPDQISIKDLEGRFVCVSRSLVARLGCVDASEVLGKTDFDFLSTERARRAYSAESRIMKTGEALLGIEELETAPGGCDTWVSTNKLPLYDADGTVIGVLAISSDIIPKKHAAEPSNSDAAPDHEPSPWSPSPDFVYVASRDLPEPPRLGADYTEPVATADVVDRAIGSLETALAEAGAVVDRGELPVVRGDAGLLGNVFESLIEYALTFRGERSPQIRIGAELGRLGWTFSVVDNGSGIPPELGDGVFAVERRPGPGENGVGLSSCKQIVERHGGVIWFDSTPGEGTTFRFVLPSRKG